MAPPQGRVRFGLQQKPYGRAICEAEMRWIERIHELATQGFSTEKIAQLLNKEDRETKRAEKWSRTAVWGILKRFKKKAVTKSFCNGPSESTYSVTPPIIASKAPPAWMLTNSSTGNAKSPRREKPKRLQINHFQTNPPSTNAHLTAFPASKS